MEGETVVYDLTEVTKPLDLPVYRRQPVTTAYSSCFLCLPRENAPKIQPQYVVTTK